MNILDMILNPQFAKRYTSSKVVSHSVDLLMERLYPKIKLDIQGGAVKANFTPMRGTSMSVEQAIEAAMENVGLRNMTLYPAMGSVPYIGGSNNAEARRLQAKGYDVSVSSWDMDDQTVRTFLDQYGYPGNNGQRVAYGIVRPNGSRFIHVNAVKDGKPLTRSEMMSVLGYQGSDEEKFLKRLGVLTSDRSLNIGRSTGRKRSLIFDQEKLFEKADPAGLARMREYAKISGQSLDEVMGKSFDGANYLTKSGFNRVLSEMRADLDYELQELENRSGDIVNYQRERAGLLARGADIDRFEREMLSGMKNNFRYIGREADEAGKFFGLKGDVMLVSDDMKRFLMSAQNLTEDEFEEFDFIASPQSRIRELLTSDSESYRVTFATHGRPHEARTNMLASIAHGDLYDPGGHLSGAVNARYAEDMRELAKGNLPEGLKRLVSQMGDVEIDESLPLARREQLIKGKAFALRLKELMDSGQNPAEDPFIAQQYLRGIREGYFGIDSRVDGKIRLDRKLMDPFEPTFPIEGSISYHPDPQFRGNGLLAGEVRFGVGAPQLNAADAAMDAAAGGGFDFDDLFNYPIQYDPHTKRLLSPAYRDPVEVSEYVYKSVNVAVIKVDPILDRMIPREIREWDIKLKKANQKLLATGRTNSREKNLELLAERDEAAARLSAFYENSDNIPKIDLASRFAYSPSLSGAPVPKGYKLSEESLRRYEAGSPLRSYLTSAEIAGDGDDRVERFLELLMEESAEEKTLDAGRMPYAVSPGANSWYDRLYGQNVKDIAAQTAKAGTSTTDMDEKIAQRLFQEAKGSNLLGQVSNVGAAIDSVLLNAIQGMPDPLALEIEQIIRSKNLAYAEKELTVDQIKQIGQTNLIDVIREQVVQENPRRAGEALAEARRAVQRWNQLHPDAPPIPLPGVDAAIGQMRASKDFVGRFMSGFQSIDDSVEDIAELYTESSTIAKQIINKANLSEDFEAESEKLMREIRTKFLKSMEDIDFTPQEMSRASDFISRMREHRRHLQGIEGRFLAEDEDFIREFLTSSEIPDTMNTQGLRILHEYGLFNSTSANGNTMLEPTENLHRQILAIAKTLTENEQDMGMIRSIDDSTINGSLGHLFTEAKKALISGPKVNQQLAKAKTLAEINEFFTSAGGEIGFSDVARGASDVHDMSISLLRKMMTISNTKVGSKTRGELAEKADFLINNLEGMGHNANAIRRFRSTYMARLRSTNRHNMPVLGGTRVSSAGFNADNIPSGTGRFTQRAIADDAADFVSSVGREEMTRIDSEFIKKLWSQPLGKGLIVGAGIFAGIGLVHRLAKNPTPEELGGPPMLPAGSPYEDYDAVGYDAVSSMYPSTGGVSSSGMQYTVTTSSGYDPQRLSTNLSDITGGSATTNIYTSRRTVGKKAYSSRDILKDRRG